MRAPGLVKEEDDADTLSRLCALHCRRRAAVATLALILYIFD